MWKVSMLPRVVSGKPPVTWDQVRPASWVRKRRPSALPPSGAVADGCQEAVPVLGVDGDCTAVEDGEAVGAVPPGLPAVTADVHGAGGVGVDTLVRLGGGGHLVDVFVQVGCDRLPGRAPVWRTHDAAYVDVGIDPAVCGVGEAAQRGRTAPGGVPLVSAFELIEGFDALDGVAREPVEVRALGADEEEVAAQDEKGFDGVGNAGGDGARPVFGEKDDVSSTEGDSAARRAFRHTFHALSPALWKRRVLDAAAV